MSLVSDNKKVIKNILGFSLPYLFSVFMQTLYGMADLFIIGRFCAVDSTTAVSIGSQVMHMITVMIVGLSMGTTVLIGKSVGAKDDNLKNNAIGNTVVLFVILSLLISGLLIFCVDEIVNIMSTPKDAVLGTVKYLTVCFIGIPFITAYNIISAVFRGMGNSKTPMYFVAVACLSNIILDLIFIGGLGMGPVGAALGTTLSQMISVVFSLIYITKKDIGIKIKKDNLKIKKTVIGEIFKVGIPVALQDGFIQISFLVITMFANLRGIEDAAAVGVVEKIIGILFLVPSAMLSTVSALSAQYIGAKKINLAKLTLKYGVIMCVSFGTLIVIIMQFASEGAVSLFTKDAVAITLGGQYMRGYVWDCILAGIHFCFSGYFCACKKSGISFMHNCISILVARIPLAYMASKYFADTLMPMGFATSVGSCISVIICIVCYNIISKKQEIKLK